MTSGDSGDHHLDPDRALAEADRLASTVRFHSRWHARYLLMYGVGVTIAVTCVNLLEGPLSAIIWGALWATFVISLALLYARRQPVSGKDFAARLRVTIGPSFLLFFVALFPGVVWFEDAWWWWAVWGPLVGLPNFIGAYMVARR